MAVEACIDIANHIISYEGLREPHSNQDAFEVLSENGMLDSSLVRKLKRMAQFRNILVHDYIKVDPEIVFGILQAHLGDIRTFGIKIKELFTLT